MFRKILNVIVLPEQITEFEDKYLRRVNRFALLFFALHVPLLTALAFLNDTRPLQAALFSAATLLGPAIAQRTFASPRNVSIVFGFTSMLMGALLVHFGQGPVQIEMHFYFFAALAMLSVYGNPMVILIAAATVAAHHLLLWFILPQSVFNYEAPVWVVAVHAAFVVLESVATCFIARSFFDNVIGLERIVKARTQELAARTRDMRLVLDHVAQGLVMVERDGTVSRERSAAIDKWIGAPAEGAKFAEHLSPVAPMAADLFALGLEELLEGVMPPELTLDQMPKRFTSDGSTYELEYTPITSGDGEIEKLLVVVSDVTAACEKEKAETERRELAHLVDRLMRDRRGLVEFIEESALHVEIVEAATSDSELVKRALHTLKGNSALFGFHSLAGICHDIETHIVEMRAAPTQTHRDRLSERFTRLRTQLDGFLGADSGSLDVAAAEYEALRRAVADRAPHAQLAQTLASWKLEPTARRLGRIAEQVESLAGRLGKGPVKVAIDDGGVRLDAGQWRSFWSSFVHVMKNAVDHGLEAPEERVAAGKPAAGSVTLRTRLEASSLLVEIADDGRGIDWDAVAVKATELGLPHGDPDQLVEALFANGVSTKDSANEISGRGIGMGAIRAECQARGGAVELETRSSGGTRVTCRFPMQSARPTLDQTAA